MEDEQRRLKLLNDLQKYVPFLRSMIASLQNASKTQEKQRSPQLNKMMSLLALLTDQNKRLKVHTLEKCEDVLRKLYEKMESNKKRAEPKLPISEPNVKNENKFAESSPLNIVLNKLNLINTSAPASPSPPPFDTSTKLSKPIIIPTERVCDLGTRNDNQYASISSLEKKSFDSYEEESNALYTRRPTSTSKITNTAQYLSDTNIGLDIDNNALSLPNQCINLVSPTSSQNNSFHSQISPLKYKQPDLEVKKISVFDRLGEKLTPMPETVLKKNISSPLKSHSNEKVPKSATLISNLTKQLKEAQMQQEIASDIANYLTEDSMKDSNAKVLLNFNEQLNQPYDVIKKHESCGIKKSTPILKVAPSRKIDDISQFSEKSVKTDKSVIDKTNTRKTSEIFENSKDETFANCNKPNNSKNSQTVNKESGAIDILNNRKSCFSSTTNEILSDIDRSSDNSLFVIKTDNKKHTDSYQRLSDKYPRKKISDSASLDQFQKNSSNLSKSSSNLIMTSNLDYSNRSNINSVQFLNSFESGSSFEEGNSKIKIPDVKINDPRIKLPESAMAKPFNNPPRNIVQSHTNTLFSNPQSGHRIPSIVDMDYRYVPNSPHVSGQPQLFPSNTNFLPHEYNTQNFVQIPPLLTSPNYSARNCNANNYNNQEDFYSARNHECNEKDFFYDNREVRSFTNDFYDPRNQTEFETADKDYTSIHSNKNDFMHTNTRFQDNSRNNYSGANNYNCDNKYQWSNGRNKGKKNEQKGSSPNISNAQKETIIGSKTPNERNYFSSDSSRSTISNSIKNLSQERCRQNILKHSDNKRTEHNEKKSRYSNNFKRFDKKSSKSPQKKNIQDTSSSSKNVMNSFKIPKIKKNIEKQENETDSKIENKTDQKNQLNLSNDAHQKINEDIVVQTTDKTDVKVSDESENNDEKILLTKLLDMISEIYKHKEEPKDNELNILQKLEEKIGSKKVEKIKQIIDGADSDFECDIPKKNIADSPFIKKTKKKLQKIESDSSDEEIIVTNIENEHSKITNVNEVQKSNNAKPKRRNALEMLQHDVRDMFICEGVLTATGRRMCRILKEDSVVESNSSMNKEDPHQRKLRKNIKKTNFDEVKSDPILNHKDDDSNDETTVNFRLSPRIILEKLENINLSSNKQLDLVRRRNVARRGRIKSSFAQRISTNQVASENFAQTCENNVMDDTDTIEEVDNLKKGDADDLVNEKGIIIKSSSPNKSTKAKIKEIKKKIKRKGAWKMGILRSKKRIRKTNSLLSQNINEFNTSNGGPDLRVKINFDETILNTDKNYFIDETTQYSCKLCAFYGKLITSHYIQIHPNKEVYSSRINPADVEVAKKMFCSKSAVEESESENKNKGFQFCFQCLFCKEEFLNSNTILLVEHLSSHTGEYRYMCNICKHIIRKRDSLRHHFKNHHKHAKIKPCSHILYDIPFTKNNEIHGFICEYCNFTQIFENNIKKHIKINHPEKEIKISKIKLFKRTLNTDVIEICDNIGLTVDENVKTSNESNVPTFNTNDSNANENSFKNNELESLPIFIIDKAPFLSETNVDLDKVDITFSDALINNSRPMFKPFVKKMTITGALQSKFNHMRDSNNSSEDFVVPQNNEPQSNFKELDDKIEKSVDRKNEHQGKLKKLNDKIEKSVDPKILSDNEGTIVQTPSKYTPLFSKTNDGKNINTSILSKEVTLDKSDLELHLSDEQDSNDSESLNSPQPSLNVNEVLQNFETNLITHGIMSNTIQRLACSLISSPTKVKNIVSENDKSVIKKEKNKVENAFDLESDLPPSEPIVINKVIQKSTKLQIGTIRISITPENIKVYECFEKGCVYSSANNIMFLDHIEKCHNNSKWNGFCNICGKLVMSTKDNPDNNTLIGCFKHALTHDENKKETKCFLKMRRLSGDILSTVKSPSSNDSSNVQVEESFLKITNVVSLSENIISAQDNNASSSNLPELLPQIICEDNFENSQKSCKPWLSSNKNIAHDIKDEMLMNLFKCMFKSCNFTSNNVKAFEYHLNEHNAKNDDQDYLECSYCDKTYESIKGLVDHVLASHKYCNYQCRHCYYRCLCKAQINFHIDTYHKEAQVPNVLLLRPPSELNQFQPKDVGNPEYVLPYQCSVQGCNFTSKSKQIYAKHLESHNMSAWSCFLCDLKFSSLDDLFEHTEVHNLNSFHCFYCGLGASNNKQITQHITDFHSEKNVRSYFRVKEMKKWGSAANEVVECNLDVKRLHQNVVIKKFDDWTEFKQISTAQKNNLNSSLEKTNVKFVYNSLNTSSSDSDDDNLIIDDSLHLENANIANNLDSFTSPKIIEELSAKENEPAEISFENSSLTVDSELIGNKAETLNSSVIEKLDDKIITEKHTSNDTNTNSTSNCASSVDSLKQFAFDNTKLFKCTNCNASFDSSLPFKNHLRDCIKSDTFDCTFCTKQFRSINLYVDHLKGHGICRYKCGFCNYRAAREFNIKLHAIKKHKKNAVKIFPIDPLKTHPDKDFFICAMQPPKQEVQKQEGLKTNSYTPNDIDKLPRNSIYFKDVECALCSFKTKVRTNIIRHLQQHNSENAVSEVCPVNAVPCLTTNEKHFDKMKNLACSSHIEKTEDQNIQKNIKSEDVLPKFVIESKRFVCGIVGCTYLTVNEEMLRHHFLALHAEETCYICPHCPNNAEKFTGTINIDKIVSHLKLHDTKLYKCPYCNYHKSQKHIIERHITDKHPNFVNHIVVIREDSSVSSKTAKRELKDKTWMCGLCDFTAYDRAEIVKHTWEEHGMKSQFKCALCQFRCSYRNSFTNHFAVRHANEEIDIVTLYKRIEKDLINKSNVIDEPEPDIDTTPLWSRGSRGLRHIRGILLEEDNTEKILQNSDKKVRTSEYNTKTETNSDLQKIPAKRKRSNTSTSDIRSPKNKKSKQNVSIDNAINTINRKRSLSIVNSETGEETPQKINETANQVKQDKSKSMYEKESLTQTSFEGIDILAKQSKTQESENLVNVNKINELEHNSDADKQIISSSNKVSPVSITPIDIICLSSDEDEKSSNFLSTTSLPPLLDETRYGDPLNGKYRCSFCEEYLTDSELEMFGHLCNELQYVRYSCKTCSCVSWSKKQLKQQCEKTHSNTVALIKELKINKEMESWISKAIQHQKLIIYQSAQKQVTESNQIEMVENFSVNNLETKDETYSCNLCSYTTKFIGFFERHEKSHLLKLYKCGHCSMVGPRKQLESHIKNTHPDKEVILVNYSSDDLKEDVNDSLDNPADMDIKDGQRRVYLCHYCPKKGYSIDEIEEHWKIKHKNPKYNSDGKITKYALPFQYKETTEEEYLKKVVPKNIFSCEHCGRRGYYKVLKIHHKAKHPDLTEKIISCSGKPGFKCDLCGFFVHLDKSMKKHFCLIHPGIKASYTETFDEAPTSVHQIYKCNYCDSTFESLSDITEHHEKLHSHKNLVLNVADGNAEHEPTAMRQLYKCPMCTNAFEAYEDTCQHIQTHIKPFACNYCSDGFSFTDTIKLHIKRVHPDKDINCYSAVPYTKEKIKEAIAKIEVIYKNRQNLFNNENLETTRDSSASKQDSKIKSNLKAIARKSTTKLPMKTSVAKKSTAKLNSSNSDLFISHYKNNIKYDNSNIHTVVNLGGKPIRLNIENLEAITNIHPTLKIVDMKNQLTDRSLSSNLR